MTGQNQYRAAPRPPARFQVADLITYHHAPLQIHPEGPTRTVEKAGIRLPALARHPILPPSLGVVRAVEYPVEAGTFGHQQVLENRVNGLDFGLGAETPCHHGLVRDHEHGNGESVETPHSLDRTGKQPYLLWPLQVVHVFNENPVPVHKDRRV